MVGPPVSLQLLKIGSGGNPELFGLEGWQWVYIFWGLPAVALGVAVLYLLPDYPALAGWLEPDEREALEGQLAREKAAHGAGKHMTVLEALRNPKVLILAGAYCGVVTGSLGLTFFMPSILESWYHLKLDDLTWPLVLPPAALLCGFVLIGWSSDRMHERRYHTVLPIYAGSAALGVLAALDAPPLWVAVALFVLVTASNAYLPIFWTLPGLFLTELAAAGCIGFINSVGNLGGFFGPSLLGVVKQNTGDFRVALMILAALTALSATIILSLGLGKRPDAGSGSESDSIEPAVPEAVLPEPV